MSFDGTRVSIGIERESLDDSQLGLIEVDNLELYINGDSIKNYAGLEDNNVSIFMSPVQNKDAMIFGIG
ncbi:hypothetical protein ACFSQ7_46445 [Paenibacillus rhizoplanae]